MISFWGSFFLSECFHSRHGAKDLPRLGVQGMIDSVSRYFLKTFYR